MACTNSQSNRVGDVGWSFIVFLSLSFPFLSYFKSHFPSLFSHAMGEGGVSPVVLTPLPIQSSLTLQSIVAHEASFAWRKTVPASGAAINATCERDIKHTKSIENEKSKILPLFFYFFYLISLYWSNIIFKFTWTQQKYTDIFINVTTINQRRNPMDL